MHKLQKVVVVKGVTQVGNVTSAEQDTLLITSCAISAGGKFIFPFFVSPRVKFKDYTLSGAYTEKTLDQKILYPDLYQLIHFNFN